MVWCLGQEDRVEVLARQIYVNKYPLRRAPDARTFANTFQRLRDTGSVAVGRVEGVGILGNARADRILDHFAMDPTTSTLRAGFFFIFFIGLPGS